ncbi:MAG: hypothetical protein SH868_11470 [Bythopirellula sp.]|nr:hypothetical protein [Bythopirellula sp.]
MIQFNAHFDGKNLCPDEPVALPENVSLRVTVAETLSQPASASGGPLDIFDRLAAETGLIAGPTDWAAEHDHYLYGVPKNGDHADQ